MSSGGLDFDGLIVDLDGVVWIGSAAVPGSVEALAALRARGVRLLFLTNDPRGSRAEYAARLADLGVEVAEDEIVTSGRALAALLAEREGRGRTAFVIGSPSLRAELAEVGLRFLAGEAGREAEVVAVGGHEGFDYDELRIATHAVRSGARLYAAGRDATFPMPDGPGREPARYSPRSRLRPARAGSRRESPSPSSSISRAPCWPVAAAWPSSATTSSPTSQAVNAPA